MPNFRVAVLSASVRDGRNSHRVALFLERLLREERAVTTDLIDLRAYGFPMFHERLRLQKDPSAAAVEFASRIQQADGVIIATPEYNGGYPAALKNAIDLLYTEWHRKPTAISTASNGSFGGAQVITSLQFSLWKMQAWTVPAMFPVPNVDKAFTEDGVPNDPEATHKRATSFVNELFWCMEASAAMRAKA